MTFTGISESIEINGTLTVCITGDVINTTIEYQPDRYTGDVWFPLQQEIGTDTAITATATFNVSLPLGKIRFNGGTNVTVLIGYHDQ